MKLFKLTLLSILLIVPAFRVFSYDAPTTHAGITEQTIYFYENKFSSVLSTSEKEQIIKGSIDEDNFLPRVLNHFYDPIRNIGINNFKTAKDWATSKNTGNYYTWQDGIQAYAEGDKDRALYALGHIMHLIQDMTVPDHTRNDAHVGLGMFGFYTGESSYEIWAQKNKYRGTLNNLSNNLLNQKPKIFQDVLEYFDCEAQTAAFGGD